jgi:hypothetical protein
MRRRNLRRTHRHLMPDLAPGLPAQLRQERALAETAGLLADRDPVLSIDADQARIVAIRFVHDELISTARKSWIGGVPTRAALASIEKRTAKLLAIDPEEIAAALKGHPKPQTCG